MTYLLSSEIIHMITVSFDDVRRWRSLRTLALMDGDRGLAPKSGHSISSGSDSIPLMGMGPGSSGMMPLSSMPWWICLALRRTRSVASEVKLPGSETVDGWGEVERKGGSEKGEREEERREQGRIEWGEITYKISFSLFPLTLISPGLIPTLPRNHTFMIVYSILLIFKMHGHCIVYRHAIQWTTKLKTSHCLLLHNLRHARMEAVCGQQQWWCHLFLLGREVRVGWSRD